MVLHSGIEVVSNQVSFSLLDQRAAVRWRRCVWRSGVRLLAYGTIAGGWLTERWVDQPEPDWQRTGTWSQMKYGRFIRAAGGWAAFQRVLAAAARVAARHQTSIANVASRFILDQPGVAAVIVGARLGEREHIADTARLFAFALHRRRPRTSCRPPLDDASAHSRRLRRRVSEAAVSHRLGRPQSSPRRHARALRGGRERRRPRRVPERDIVGADCRVRPRGTARAPNQRFGHHRHAGRARHRRARSGRPGALRHRQDRGRPPVARRVAWRRRPHARLRAATSPIGNRSRAPMAPGLR